MCENCKYFVDGECPFSGNTDLCIQYEDESAKYDIEYTNEWEGA